MVFKNGQYGLGYYADGGGAPVMEMASGRQAVKLNLCALIPELGEERKPWRRTRARKARGKRRKPRGPEYPKELEGADFTSEREDGSRWEGTSTGSAPSSRDTTAGSDIDMESVATIREESEEGGGSSSESWGGSEGEAEWGDGAEEDEDMSEEEQEEAGRKRGWWIMDTVNANSWGGMAGAVKGRGALDFLHRTVADVVMVQETKLSNEGKQGAAYRAARRAKWNLWAPVAAVTEKGYSSAGVAVAARVGFGVRACELPQGVEFDHTRIAHRHIGIMCRGGVHVFSVYLHTAQGLSESNKELLRQLARLVKMVRGPWVIGGG